MNRNRIKKIIELLRNEYDLKSLPVDLEKITQKLEIRVMEQQFEEGLSGFAYQKSGNKFIGVNSSELSRRKRFTIAHELGHLFLHKQDAVNYDPAIMYFRDSHSSDGTDIKEIEANAFAAELLMPEDEVRKLIVKRGGLNMEDTSAIQEMADSFEVSLLAMTIRLTNLYFSSYRL